MRKTPATHKKYIDDYDNGTLSSLLYKLNIIEESGTSGGKNVDPTDAVRPNGQHNDASGKRAEEVQRKIRSAKERLL